MELNQDDDHQGNTSSPTLTVETALNVFVNLDRVESLLASDQVEWEAELKQLFPQMRHLHDHHTSRDVMMLTSPHDDNQGYRGHAMVWDQDLMGLEYGAVGANDPSTLTAISRLDASSKRRRIFSPATISLLRFVHDKWRRRYGEDDLRTMKLSRIWAEDLPRSAGWPGAVPTREGLVCAMTRVLSDGYLDTLDGMEALARILREQEDWAWLVQVQRERLPGAMAVHGDDSAEVTEILQSLAGGLACQGHGEESSRLCEVVLSRNASSFGRNHPATVDAVKNLQLVYSQHLPDAELAVRLEASLRTSLGEDDRRTLIAQSRLADTLANTGHSQQAITAFTHLVPRMKAAFGDTRQTFVAQVNFAHALRIHGGQEALERAITVLRDLEPRIEPVLGPNHEYRVMTWSNLAVCYLELGKMMRAKVESIGPDHVVQKLNELATGLKD